jgi:hypothetical protein
MLLRGDPKGNDGNGIVVPLFPLYLFDVKKPFSSFLTKRSDLFTVLKAYSHYFMILSQQGNSRYTRCIMSGMDTYWGIFPVKAVQRPS